MFWEVVFGVFVGGGLLFSTLGWCLFIAWRWVFKDVMKDLEKAYDVYLKRSYETFEEK